RGSEELGAVLMRAFLGVLGDIDTKPRMIIFFNTAVKLTVQSSRVLDLLEKLVESGVTMLVCGTCLDYFSLKDQVRVGIVSNMYDIADTMLTADRLVFI
ncbi:sulfurtransferase-like selenium metabolism protein YedF, partial [bacterium]|nr:sulfurtransferase-like selenium metabolism protein YedF [candidate division CSSED10-310 bacterium]